MWPGSGPSPVHAVFIRAPVVERAGPGRGAGHAAGRTYGQGPGRHPAGVPAGAGPGQSFHPELTGDRRLHQLFVEMTKEERH